MLTLTHQFRISKLSGAKRGRKLLTQALNRATTGARTELARAIAKNSGFTVGQARRAITVQKGPPAFRVVAKGRPQNLIDFRPRETRKGITARPWGRVRVPGAFIAAGKVFIRTDRWRHPSRRGQTKHSEGLRPLFGPGVANEARRADSRALKRAIRKRIGVELKRAIKRA